MLKIKMSSQLFWSLNTIIWNSVKHIPESNAQSQLSPPSYECMNCSGLSPFGQGGSHRAPIIPHHPDGVGISRWGGHPRWEGHREQSCRLRPRAVQATPVDPAERTPGPGSSCSRWGCPEGTQGSFGLTKSISPACLSWGLHPACFLSSVCHRCQSPSKSPTPPTPAHDLLPGEPELTWREREGQPTITRTPFKIWLPEDQGKSPPTLLLYFSWRSHPCLARTLKWVEPNPGPSPVSTGQPNSHYLVSFQKTGSLVTMSNFSEHERFSSLELLNGFLIWFTLKAVLGRSCLFLFLFLFFLAKKQG